MFGIGAGELVLILIAGLIIFGPSELPKIGRAVGKGLREFRKAQAAFTATLDEVSAEPEKKSSTTTEKVSIEKKSADKVESSKDEKMESVSDKKIAEVEKNVPAIENLSADENPPHSALTVDEVISLAKQSPLNKETSVTLDPVGANGLQTEKNSSPRSNDTEEKEKLDEKNFTDTATTATADTNASNVTAGGNTDSTAK